MNIDGFFLITPKWKQPKCSQQDEWINKWWHTHAIEYYLAIKKTTTDRGNNMNKSQQRCDDRSQSVPCILPILEKDRNWISGCRSVWYRHRNIVHLVWGYTSAWSGLPVPSKGWLAGSDSISIWKNSQQQQLCLLRQQQHLAQGMRRTLCSVTSGFVCLFVCLFVVMVLGFELRTLGLVGRHPTLEPCPQPYHQLFIEMEA
jgi:hypothetical protein